MYLENSEQCAKLHFSSLVHNSELLDQLLNHLCPSVLAVR